MNLNSNKISNIIRVAAFALVLIIIPIVFLFTPKKSVSEDENRVLSVMPKLSFKTYVSRDFMNGAADFMSDHFPMRTNLISIKNGFEKVILKNEINGVLNIDGQLVEIFRNPDNEIKSRNCEAINSYAKKHNTVFALAPTSQNYISDSLPFYAYQTDESEYISECYALANNAKSVDLCGKLNKSGGEYLYYRTDHHWSANGAYNAYSALSSELNFTAHSKNEYDITSKSDSFLGTLYSKTLENDLVPDSIFQYSLKNEPSSKIYDNSGKLIHDSIYYPKSLDLKDKYSYYLGGNKGVINIKTNSNTGKNLLVIKDSYFNSVCPLLCAHYDDITVVDLRYASIDELKSINTDKFENTLIMYNVIGFSAETTVTKLKYIN